VYLNLQARIAEANRLYPEVWDGFRQGIGPLEAGNRTPLGVMVSGGGDSVALLHLLWFWGQRPLHVFCVDHRLNPQSQHWTAAVARLCGDLGVSFTALIWDGDKPAHGIQAAARRARHRLINEAARAACIRILCLGHNADDGLEADLMRNMGSSVGRPRAWGPSPLWPEGRDLFYLRPVLGVARGRLRDWLKRAEVAYIDDPANDNPAYLRAQARQVLAQSARPEVADAPSFLPVMPDYDPLSASLRFEVRALYAVEPSAARHTLGCALVCAGGGDRLPRQESLRALYDALRSGAELNHSLCGARIWRLADQVVIGRNSGEFVRRPLTPVVLPAGATRLWDGRYELTGGDVDGAILPLRGQRRFLAAQDMQRLKALPAALRASLPVWRGGDGILHLIPAGGGVQSLVFRRFCAHAGFWRREGDILP